MSESEIRHSRKPSGELNPKQLFERAESFLDIVHVDGPEIAIQGASIWSLRRTRYLQWLSGPLKDISDRGPSIAQGAQLFQEQSARSKQDALQGVVAAQSGDNRPLKESLEGELRLLEPLLAHYPDPEETRRSFLLSRLNHFIPEFGGISSEQLQISALEAWEEEQVHRIKNLPPVVAEFGNHVLFLYKRLQTRLDEKRRPFGIEEMPNERNKYQIRTKGAAAKAVERITGSPDWIIVEQSTYDISSHLSKADYIRFAESTDLDPNIQLRLQGTRLMSEAHQTLNSTNGAPFWKTIAEAKALEATITLKGLPVLSQEELLALADGAIDKAKIRKMPDRYDQALRALLNFK